MNDVPRIKTQCRKKFADWRGPEAVYIGANQWAFSATKSHDIVFSCPANVGQPPLRTVKLPAVGIFERERRTGYFQPAWREISKRQIYKLRFYHRSMSSPRIRRATAVGGTSSSRFRGEYKLHRHDKRITPT
ncbi:hypothetical protein OUZ56_005431 [Daphnia magna]|uniref:Uncharacterized protein n=1 Tax=Daphnia magna TaxID=35525 RepID=A0ABQ9YSS5_9CRUS|nr:hypothetical protein OUZ56_005431 [Daphnia magna]